MVGDQQRPLTVVAFELLSIAAVILDLVVAGSEGDLHQIDGAALWLAISALLLALILWITRGQSQIGRLIYTGITILSLVVVAFGYWLGEIDADDQPWLDLLFGIEAVISMSLLWWPSTSAWLRVRHD